MQVMGWNDIRLSPEESKQIIRIKAGTRLSGDAVDSILNRTDGWAAGIVLMSEQFKTGAQSSEETDAFLHRKRSSILLQTNFLNEATGRRRISP